ncbi:secreted protein [gut metagenome]|uniref:Secreted protein n=1 Tax=gut metagenome TaxID=749906 RepID=J9G7E0_9ZZZZ
MTCLFVSSDWRFVCLFLCLFVSLFVSFFVSFFCLLSLCALEFLVIHQTRHRSLGEERCRVE